MAETYMDAFRNAIGSSGPGTGSGVTVGDGNSAGFVNVLDYGADRTGVALSDNAFRAAAAAGPMFIPHGYYAFSGTVFTTQTPMLYTPRFEGVGPDWSVLSLPAGAYFIDTAVPVNWLDISRLQFVGGAGMMRNTYASGNSSGIRTIRECYFNGYTKTAISIASSDSPNWNIMNNRFNGANFNTTMGYAHGGWCDQTIIQGNSFEQNRVHVKQCRGGPNLYVLNNFFARFGASTGYPRVDVWLVDEDTGTPNNNGNGQVIQGNKFGNEGLETTDWRIVIADEGTGTGVDDKFPDLTNASTYYHIGMTVANNLHMMIGGTVPPLVRSMTPNLLGATIGPNTQTGSTTYAPLLSLKNATGFLHKYSLVGPAVAPTIDQTASQTYVVADGGTLTGQPNML
jgi:hypothetical protein